MKRLRSAVRRLETRHGAVLRAAETKRIRARLDVIVADEDAREAMGRIAEVQLDFGTDSREARVVIDREWPTVGCALAEADAKVKS